MPFNTHFSVLILAGGKSERMAFPKAFLPMGEGTMASTIIDVYQLFTTNIYMVLNYEFATVAWQKHLDQIIKKTCIVINHYPEKERFYSIKTGLSQIKPADFCFIQNIDNPVTANTVNQLWDARNPDGYTVPAYEGKKGHPILISNKIINDVLQTADTDTLWNVFLKAYDKKTIPVSDPEILLNINTITAYEQWASLKTPVDNQSRKTILLRNRRTLKGEGLRMRLSKDFFKDADDNKPA